MTQNYTETPNKVLDLVSESYSNLLNAWLWGTQRVLEFNKLVVSQLEVSQAEGRKYIEEANRQTRQGVQLLQEAYQQGLKNYTTNLRTWRSASESTVAELNDKLEQMQQQLDSTVTTNHTVSTKAAKN